MRQNCSQLPVDERNQFHALQQAEMPMTEIAEQLAGFGHCWALINVHAIVDFST